MRSGRGSQRCEFLTLGGGYDSGAASFVCDRGGGGVCGVCGAGEIAAGGEAGGDSADRGGLGGAEAVADFGKEEALGGVDLWTLMSF